MTTMTGALPVRRIHAVWTAAHVPAGGVPRWAQAAALAIPLTVLPSSVWRIAVCTFHAPIVRGDLVSAATSSGLPWMPLWLYVILLSIVSELAAFTAVGLVAPPATASSSARCSATGWPRWPPGSRPRSPPSTPS